MTFNDYLSSAGYTYRESDDSLPSWSPDYVSKSGWYNQDGLLAPQSLDKLRAQWEYTQPLDWGSITDPEGAGLISINPTLAQDLNREHGTNFSSTEDYWKWVYGGGELATSPSGQQWFRTPSGAQYTVNTPLEFKGTYTDSGWDNFMEAGGSLMIVGGIAAAGTALGAGAMGAEAGAGALGAAESAFPTVGIEMGSAGLTGTGVTGAVTGSMQAVDGIAQSLYDTAAASGTAGYDAALTSGVAAGGAPGSSLSTIDPWDMLAPQATPSAPADQPWGVNERPDIGAMQEIDGSMQTIYDQNAMGGVAGYDPSLASNMAGVSGFGGGEKSLVDSVIDWAKGNQQLASTGLTVAGGFIKGAMSPSPEEVFKAKADAEAQALAEKRQFGQIRGINLDRLKPTGRVLRQSGSLPPGLINRAMVRS